MSDIQAFCPLWGVWVPEGDPLGEGSFGTVWKVKRVDSVLGQMYAAVKHISIPKDNQEIKALLEEGIFSDKNSARQYYENMRASLEQEISVMYTLRGYKQFVSYEDHLMVPKPDGVGYDMFLRMELLTPLTAKIKQGMPEQDVIKLGVDIATAIEILNAHGLVHRDIKPQNVFIDNAGNYKLGDYGTVHQMRQTQSIMSRKGTFSYMAPEIFKNGAANRTVDIYSLGIMLYRLLNWNRLPFIPIQGDQTMELRERAFGRRMAGEPLPPPANGSDELKQVVLKACAFRAADRYQSGGELRAALLSCASVQDSSIHSVKSVQPPYPTSTIQETSGPSIHPITESASSSFRTGESSATGSVVPRPKKEKSGNMLLLIPAAFLILALGVVVYGLRSSSKPKYTATQGVSFSPVQENPVSSLPTETVYAAPTVSVAPNPAPTAAPNPAPQFVPAASSVPTTAPVRKPTYLPTSVPTARPTSVPTAVPPTSVPTPKPTPLPTSTPVANLSAREMGLRYSVVSSGCIEITYYTGSISDLVIPEKLDGYTVVSIGEKAFDCGDPANPRTPVLTSIVLPDTVRTIGKSAFSHNEILQSVKLPSQLSVIGEDAFSWCTCVREFELPNTVTSIGSYAFDRCYSLEKINLPSTVNRMGYSVFSYCTSLTEITLPPNVRVIDNNSFYGCANLVSVTLPSACTRIGIRAFYDCVSLKNMLIPRSVTEFGENAFTNCSNLTATVYSGSTAQNYCQRNRIAYQLAD